MEIYFNILDQNGNTFYQTCLHETLSEQGQTPQMQTLGQGRPQLTDVKLSWEKMKVLEVLLEFRAPWVRSNCLSGPRGMRGAQGWTASPRGLSVRERRRGLGAAGRLVPSRHSLRKGPLLPPQPRSCCLTDEETWRAALATARQGLCPPTALRHPEWAELPGITSCSCFGESRGLCFPSHLRSPKAALGYITGTLSRTTLSTRRCPLTGVSPPLRDPCHVFPSLRPPQQRTGRRSSKSCGVSG